MLRYTTDRPGLVALYDIRPGNGMGPFLQPRSPHGAHSTDNTAHSTNCNDMSSAIGYHVGPGTRKTHHETMKQYIEPTES